VGGGGLGGGSGSGRRHSPPQTQHRDHIEMNKMAGEIAIENTN
jgi:hypothetical protein